MVDAYLACTKPRVGSPAPYKPDMVVKPVIPALKRWRREAQNFKVIFKVSLGCMRPCLLQKKGEGWTPTPELG